MLPEIDWQQLNWSQTNSTYQTTFGVLRMNNYGVGLNSLANKYCILNRKIQLDWLNKSWTPYKIVCKNLFILE
jgi:hypothetical protein